MRRSAQRRINIVNQPLLCDSQRANTNQVTTCRFTVVHEVNILLGNNKQLLCAMCTCTCTYVHERVCVYTYTYTYIHPVDREISLLKFFCQGPIVR